MYEDLMVYAAVVLIAVGVAWSYLGVRTTPYIVDVEKYPTGIFKKVSETANGINTKVHGTKVAWIKKNEPLVLQWGRRFIRLFRVQHGNRDTLSWEKDVPLTAVDEVENQAYVDQEIFKGLKASARSFKRWALDFLPGLFTGFGLSFIVFKLLGWLV